MGDARQTIRMLFLALLWLWTVAAATAQEGPKFTAGEQQWLDKRAKIWIGTIDAWPPMSFLDDSRIPAGIGADYIKEMNRLLDGRLNKKGSVLAMAVSKDKPELAGILDKTLAAIPEERKQAIRRK